MNRKASDTFDAESHALHLTVRPEVYEDKDEDDIETVSEISSLNVSSDEEEYNENRSIEYIDRFVLDTAIKRGLFPHSIMITKLSEWALERYERDRENFTQLTVDAIEKENRHRLRYVTDSNTDWEWLFETMGDGRHVPTGPTGLPHVFSTALLLQFATLGPNILVDIGNGMRLKDRSTAEENSVDCSDDFCNVGDKNRSGPKSEVKEKPPQNGGKMGIFERFVRLFRKPSSIYKC